MLLYDKKQIIQQAKFTYSAVGKGFEKQIKTIEDQEKKQVDVFITLKPVKDNKPDDDEKLLRYK